MSDPLGLELPVMKASSVTLKKSTLQLWRGAIHSITEAQDKFLAAYRATLNETIPGWEKNWRNSPHFVSRLIEVEDYMKALCRENGMELTAFNRYRKGARATLLMDVPFKLGANFTLEELRHLKRSGNPVREAKRMRQARKVKQAEAVLSQIATVLPLPEKGENPLDYVEGISGRLAEYLFAAREKLSAEAYGKLITLLHRFK
jgi:hypothetical protein